MFSSNMMESAKGGNVDIHDVSASCFKGFLYYLYTDNLPQKNIGDIALELLMLSNLYNVPRLMTLLEKIITASIEDETVCDLLQAAEAYQADQLKGQCIRYLKRRLYKEEMSEKEVFEKLSKELRNDVLAAMDRVYDPNKPPKNVIQDSTAFKKKNPT